MKKLKIFLGKFFALFPQKMQLKLILPFYHSTSIFYKGNNVYCPYCKRTFRKFHSHGVYLKPGSRCPFCGSLERYRLLYLYLENKTDFFKKKIKVLEIGPTNVFHKLCLSLAIDYTSIDLYSNLATIKMDVTNMAFQNNTFNCVICYHVLEHVRDDVKAMQEIYRVLQPGGFAILQVPIANIPKTMEDLFLSEKEREKQYGGNDHLRLYGNDYTKKLELAGFKVKVDDYVKHISKKSIKRYGLDEEEYIYYCIKEMK